MTTHDNIRAAAIACLAETVQHVKDEGLARAGTEEGLFAYEVLNRLRSNAKALGVPLADIGLAGFDVDSLLNPPIKRAA